MIKKTCIICKKHFWVLPYREKLGARYCSSRCYGVAKIGTKLSEKTKEKMSRAFKGVCGKFVRTREYRLKLSKAHLGKKLSEQHKLRISVSVKGKNKGSKNGNWIGGRVKNCRGYIEVLSPEHPHRTNKGRVAEHRLVMEKHIKRYLKPTEIVHHINEIRDDNRIENLALFSNKGTHTNFHRKQRFKHI
jgi:hypothetical protein